MTLPHEPPALSSSAYTFLRLARRTASASWQHYEHEARPLSKERLRGLLSPNLERPLFIVGSPRSGTTFLGDCVAALPEISYHFEPVATKWAARVVYDGGWSVKAARAFYRSVYRCLMRLHLDGDLRFAEKTPRNCFIIPFLKEAFPDASFLHITRDGRDVALSYSKKPWLQGDTSGSGKREPGGYPFGSAARFWVEPDRVEAFETTTDVHRCIWAWRRFEEAAREALAVLPAERHLTVRYERLVAAPREEGPPILNFLGITDPRSRSRFQASLARGHSGSVGSWKRELPAEALADIEREAGNLLRKLGYA